MSPEQKFIDLESKLAHQEFQLEELSQVLYTQQRQIDQLQKLLNDLNKKVRDGANGNEIGPADDKPPHY